VTGSGETVIECRQITFDDDAVGLQRGRRQSRYVFDAQGGLTSAEIKDHLGNRLALEIISGEMHVGGQSRPIGEQITLILERNMAALSALLLEGTLSHGVTSFAALVPETGTLLPFSLTPCEEGWRSTLGETLVLDESGKILLLRPPASDFIFERTSRAFPKWTLEEDRPVLAYRQPTTLCVEELLLVIGTATRPATLARPLDEKSLRASGVFIGGTGVYDRHGIAAGLDIGYHHLLDDLAEEGIATLRYEKFASSVISLEEAETAQGFAEFCAQARQALTWLAAQSWKRSAPNVAIGHSLGGLVALSLAGDEKACDAVVLLNTPGRPFRHIIGEQQGWFAHASETSVNAAQDLASFNRHFIEALEAEAEWTPATVDARILALKRKRKLYRDLLDLDPITLLHRGRCPIIIVQGAADVQVTLKDAARLAQACEAIGRPCHVLIEDGLDHLLKRNAASGLKILQTYRDRRRRIPIALVRKIAKTVRSVLGD